MIVVVPMAGRGLRFANMGYEIPKWMIQVFGKTILELSLSSVSHLPIVSGYVFIVHKAQVQQYNVNRILEKFIRTDYEIVEISETEGQAHTVIQAERVLGTREVCILNCDNIVDCPIQDWIGRHQQVLPCIDNKKIPVDYPEFKSYARMSDDGMVLETAEKKIISDKIIAGMFYFRSFTTFVEAFAKMQQNEARTAGEFYIAPMFNYLTDTKGIEVTRFFDLGEPANVERFILQQQLLPKEFQFLDQLGIDYTRMGHD